MGQKLPAEDTTAQRDCRSDDCVATVPMGVKMFVACVAKSYVVKAEFTAMSVLRGRQTV